MIITILFSIFTVYNSPFFRPSDRWWTGGRGALGGDRARVPRTDGLLVCKKTVFSWWGKPVAAAVAVRLGFQVQCLPWSSAVVAVCSRKFASRRSPQTITITVVITITVIPRSDIRESRTEPILRGTTLTAVFGYDNTTHRVIRV